MNEQWVLRKKQNDVIYPNNLTKVFNEIISKKSFQNLNALKYFLSPDKNPLRDPSLLPNIEIAIERIIQALDSGEKIMIVGDYDVDGIMSTYILYHSLKKLGANIDFILPDRIKDGYGINSFIIDICKSKNIDLIITCDNGIQAFEAMEYAKSKCIDVIITDHHEVKFKNDEPIIPSCIAAVNPKIDHNYPFAGICGATVAFKICQIIYEVLGEGSISFIDEYVTYAAIATVCDVMELIDENRVIVAKGLKSITKCNNIGLKAIIQASDLNVDINVYHIGFIIGPTLNASGRLDSAELALKCLLSEDPIEALRLATKLRILNEERKLLTNEGIKNVIEIIETTGIKDDPVLVVYSPGIHESIAGIIAGKVKEKYHRPTIVFTDSNGLIKASARSIEGYNIYDELCKVDSYLLKYGGHPMAAGMSMNRSNLEGFRESINRNVNITDNIFIKKLYIDAIISFSDISYELLSEISLLEPFGNGNSKPLFSTLKVKMEFWELVGKKNNVVKMAISGDNITFNAILFKNVEETLVLLKMNNDYYYDIVYSIELNRFNNKEEIQLKLESIRLSK